MANTGDKGRRCNSTRKGGKREETDTGGGIRVGMQLTPSVLAETRVRRWKLEQEIKQRRNRSGVNLPS